MYRPRRALNYGSYGLAVPFAQAHEALNVALSAGPRKSGTVDL